MPVHLVFNLREVFPFEGLHEDSRRHVSGRLGSMESLTELNHIMSIDNHRVEPKALQSLAVLFHIMLQRCWVTLAQSVDVKDGAKVVELVEACKVESLPDVALHRLPVPNEAVSAVGRLVKVLGTVGHACSNAEPLPQRSGSHIDKRQPGIRNEFFPQLDANRIGRDQTWELGALLGRSQFSAA